MNRMRRAVSQTIRDNYDRIALHLSAEIQIDQNVDLFVVLYKLVAENDVFVRYAVSFTDPVMIEDNLVAWFTDIQVNYYFERAQRYVAQIREYNPAIPREQFEEDSNHLHFDHHTILGEAEFKLSSLMTLNPTTANSMRELRVMLRDSIDQPSTPHIHAQLIIRGDIVAEANDFVKWDLSLKNLPPRNTTVFTRFPYPVLAISKSNDHGDFAEIWNSEPAEAPHERYVLGTVRIPVSVLNNADMYKNIKFSVYDYHDAHNRQLIGEVQTTLHAILDRRQLTVLNLLEGENTASTHIITGQHRCGSVNISNVKIEKEACFPQYIVGGCQIALTVAIDFTSSNGELHRVYPLSPTGQQRLNPYEHAILEIGRILENYDSDKRYPVYGFGASLPNNGRFGPVQHCFPLHPNGVEVHGIDGILRVYHDFVSKVKFNGPTLFGPVIQRVLTEIEHAPCTQEHQLYHILLILTDDPNGDVETTLGHLIRSSEKPITVIFLGIGNRDFSAFERYLARDNGAGGRELISFADHRAVRENVLFFKFNDLLASGDLGGEILRKVPEQFLQYMAQNHITPNC